MGFFKPRHIKATYHYHHPVQSYPLLCARKMSMVPLSIHPLLASCNTERVSEHSMLRLAANLVWSGFFAEGSINQACAQFVFAIESAVSSEDQSLRALH